MKKLLSSVVAFVAALSFAVVASAIPATDQMNKSISTLENQDQGVNTVKPAKPAKKPVKKHKKAHKQQKQQKTTKGGPTPSEAPAGPGSTSSPATTPVSK